MAYQHDPQIRLIPLTRLSESPANWLIHGPFDPTGRDAWLIEDIRLNGVLTPIQIHPDGKIHDGHRRSRAAAAAGLTSIPAITMGPIESAVAFKSAQMGRNLSLYAKCIIFREELDRVRLDARAVRQGNLQRAVTRNAESEELEDAWVALELALGVGRRYIQRGMHVLDQIKALREAGDTEQAGKAEQIFREKGLNPAQRFLGGDKHKPETMATANRGAEPAESDEEELDVAEWVPAREPRKPRISTPKPELAIATCAKADETPESLKLLARLESAMKAEGCYNNRAMKALDELEFCITEKQQRAAA